MGKYIIKISGFDDVKISKNDLLKMDSIAISDSETHILEQHKSTFTKVLASNFLKKKYDIKVNNNTYQVHIQDDLDVLIEEMGFSLGKTIQVDEIKAPMPGLILEVAVKVGDQVSEGDNLLVLEAMKMENSITSPRDGIIESIFVNKGEAVEKGTILIKFE